MNKTRKILLTIFIFSLFNILTFAGSDNFTLPHTFNSGATISSTEMNQNFNFLKPYLVKSNGIPIGIYYAEFSEGGGKTFFNGTFRSSVHADGKLNGMTMMTYQDSECTIPIVSYASPGLVLRIADKNLSYKDTNNNTIFVFKEIPYYIPIDAQSIYTESDMGTTNYYEYYLWNDPPSCQERAVDTWSKTSYIPLQNDPNVTGIQNNYATPITVGR